MILARSGNTPKIRQNVLIAPTAVVKEGQVVGPGVLMAGVPAAVKRSLSEDEQHLFHQSAANYKKLARAHRALIETH